MEPSNIKSAFIRQDFLFRCLICGRTRKNNEAPFKRVGVGNETEKQLANLIKIYVGLVVNQALCCKACSVILTEMENKTKRLRDQCKKAVKSVTFFVTSCMSDADEDHNYYSGSVDKFIGSLRSDDYESILPAEIIISNDYTQTVQEATSIVEEGHVCDKCNASFSSKYFLRKHDKAEHEKHNSLAPEGNTAGMAPDRKNGYMSLRKNPRTSRFPDGSPAKKRRTDHHFTSPEQTGEGENATEGSNDDRTIQRSSLRNSLQTTRSKFKGAPLLKLSKISDQSRSGLLLHSSRAVSNKKSKSCDENKSLDIGMFKCTHCPAKFTSSLKCSAHKEVHESSYWEPTGLDIATSVDNGKQYQCKICGMEFSTDKESFQHMKKVHSDKSCRYKCKICSKSFSNVTSLRVHLQKHSSHKPFKCDCGKAFATKETYERHTRIHTREGKSHLCQFCGKLFTTKDTLDYHTRSIHLNAVPKGQVCDICGKAFDRISKLDVHKRIHSNEKNYLCDTCGRQFKNPHFLTQHRKTCGSAESGEMGNENEGSSDSESRKCQGSREKYSIPCKACLRNFPSLTLLTDHITVAHEKECIACGVSISSYKALNSHKEFCSKRDRTKQVSLSNRLMSLILEDTIKETKTMESPVNTRKTETLKPAENVDVQNTVDGQRNNRMNTPNTFSVPSTDNSLCEPLTTTSNTDSASEPQICTADQTNTQHVTTSAIVTKNAELTDCVQEQHSGNSHSVVRENTSAGTTQTIEPENQPFPTEPAISECLDNEAVEYQVDSKIISTEQTKDLSSFVNSTNILHSFESGESLNSLQTEGQETIYFVLHELPDNSDKKVEYIQLEDGQLIPSTELENVTVVDSNLTVVEENATVEYLSQ